MLVIKCMSCCALDDGLVLERKAVSDWLGVKKGQICHSILIEHLLYLRHCILRDEKHLITALSVLTAGLSGDPQLNKARGTVFISTV